jgi:voltage-gated potassium channel
MIVLGFVWLVLLIVELIRGLGVLLNSLVIAIWVIFLLDFALRFALAPSKKVYVRRNWLTAVSLVVPAARVVHIFRLFWLLRLAPAARTLTLVQVVGSLNRGMRALRASLGRRGLGYVLALTLIINLVGAAGMFAFESSPTREAFQSYGESLWWTLMITTTIGTGFWPLTPEGRALALLLSFYSIAVFGYITAAVASFFVGRDAESEQTELASARAVGALRQEIGELHEEIRQLRKENGGVNGSTFGEGEDE